MCQLDNVQYANACTPLAYYLIGILAHCHIGILSHWHIVTLFNITVIYK